MTDESKSTEVESMEVIQKRLTDNLERQRRATEAMRTTGIYASFKNANFKIDGQPIPNNKANIRVLAAIGERAYYEGEYDADQTQIPVCYALDDDAPHEQSSSPQSDACEDCEHNKWGSAARGRGKACREGARVIFVAAGLPLKSAPMVTAKIPVTSLKSVTNLTSRCSDAGKMTGEFVTEILVVEDKKSFFKVHFELKELTPNMDMAGLLNAQEKAYQLAMQPYPNMEE